MSDIIFEGGMVAPGKYMAKALPETVIFGKASTGTPQVRMSMEITSEGKFKGVMVPWSGFFTDESKARTYEQLIAAGHAMNNGDIADTTGLGSRECQITVSVTEHPETGEPQCRADWIDEPGSVFMKEVFSDEELSDFNESHKDQIKAIMASRGKPRQSFKSTAKAAKAPKASAPSATNKAPTA